MTEGRQFAVLTVGIVVGFTLEKESFCEKLLVSIVELSAFVVYLFHKSLTSNDSNLSEFGQRRNGTALAKYPLRSVNP